MEERHSKEAIFPQMLEKCLRTLFLSILNLYSSANASHLISHARTGKIIFLNTSPSDSWLANIKPKCSELHDNQHFPNLTLHSLMWFVTLIFWFCPEFYSQHMIIYFFSSTCTSIPDFLLAINKTSLLFVYKGWTKRLCELVRSRIYVSRKLKWMYSTYAYSKGWKW